MKTPIALIAFNRPEKTRKVFAAIQKYAPEKLYLIVDGARSHRPEDQALVSQVKEIFSQIDWPCEVVRDFSEKNLGCRKRVVTGLENVFQNEETAIILEDDCLPDSSFFSFCDELLERYQSEPRIMAVSGDNFLSPSFQSSKSYYFTRYFHCWGWATWRRAWKLYDPEIKIWPVLRKSVLLKESLIDNDAVSYWRRTFDLVYEGKLNTWSQQFVLSCWINQAYCINPTKNLVDNIGFDAEATNTRGLVSPANKAQEISWPLIHPTQIVPWNEADAYVQKKCFGGNLTKRLLTRAKNYIRLIVK